MKTTTPKKAYCIFLIIFSSLITFSLLFFASCNNIKKRQSAESVRDIIIKQEIKKTEQRESVTFILGEDESVDNPFYTEATNYYLYNREGKTEYVVKTCRSLSEVREWLSDNPPFNKLPWGLINLVSHGNQWVGLSIKVTPESKRATPKRTKEYLEKGKFKKLSDSVIDNKSEIFIHACGVGNNKEFVNTISDIFAAGSSKPLVRASKLFEYYTSVKNNNVVRESQRYYSKAWFTSYKMGNKPNDNILVDRLKRKYLDSDIDFKYALCKENNHQTGEPYYITVDVPVLWIIPFSCKDSLPDLSSEDKKIEWINTQTHIIKSLEQIEIPVDKFKWRHRNVYVKNDDGTKSPAVLLNGFSTMLCVLKTLTNDSINNKSLFAEPFVPDLDDGSYYYIRRGFEN